MYPALTVTEILNKAGHDILWVGTADGIEANLVQRAGIPFEGIRAAGVHGVSNKKLPGNLLKLWKGYRDSKT
ncbi:MAG TPA: glycosyltransferase, partial [Anaerolineaceae bacterium]|nr:glycosyltransferase [Anaerolineaceae bacterium]